MPAKGENGAGGTVLFLIRRPARPAALERRVAAVRERGGRGDVGATATVEALVALLGLDRRKLAVERNLEIVPRSAFGATALAEGDRIEIVAFVGGG